MHDHAQKLYEPDPPPELPPEGTRWVRCWKTATGPQQQPGRRWEAIDLGIADLVEQLQRSPDDGPPLVPTAGCCEGHHQGALPHVLLADGRVLAVLPSLEALDVIDGALAYERARRILL